MKVLSIIGTPPQFIKAAVVSHQLSKRGVNEVILHTGEHSGNSSTQVSLEEMEIPEPQYRLEIQSPNQGAMLGKMLEGIESAAIIEKPDVVIVYGDDNSALAGAIAASKLHIPIAHVEAGLRSFNMRMPEEVNRILIDRISNLLFCTSAKALDNLKLEGYDNFPGIVHNTGDVLQDAAIYYSSISSLKSDIINRLNINQSYALATISRHENIENPTKLKGIINALNLISRDQLVIAPLHSSVLKYLKDANLEPNFKIVPLLNYFDMVELLKNSNIVLTDGYGVQREAFFFGKCCVTLRNETEWTELVQNGFNMLGSTDTEFILIAYHEMLNRKPDFSMDLFGKGKASVRIAEILKNWYGEA